MVINRLNISQIQEQFINSMSNHLVDLLNKETDLLKKEDMFFKYMKIISPAESEFLELQYLSMNRAEKHHFFESVVTDGIYVHQTPFFKNATMDDFKKLFIEMPELCSDYKFKNIEHPLVMGEMYFIRLKHESGNKSSVRSTSMTNVRDLPAKNTLKKDHRTIVSSTPIRLGEMEISNLMCTKRPDLVEKLMKYYSTAKDAREILVEKLLTSKDPVNINLNNVEEYSENRQILNKYLNVLDLELEDTIIDD